jgi:hypothetical protein
MHAAQEHLLCAYARSTSHGDRSSCCRHENCPSQSLLLSSLLSTCTVLLASNCSGSSSCSKPMPPLLLSCTAAAAALSVWLLADSDGCRFSIKLKPRPPNGPEPIKPCGVRLSSPAVLKLSVTIQQYKHTQSHGTDVQCKSAVKHSSSTMYAVQWWQCAVCASLSKCSAAQPC